ncbi:MAG: hypothetical protein IKR92_00030 [Alphaproteobacteria bacterium]|nr:hypothetical protein [Alphaproteobacteria bacterium]
MITNCREALLFLVQKQQGQWNELQSQIEPKMLDWFKTMGYIRHGKDKWQITSAGVKQSLFYREPTPEEREQGLLMYQLGIL